MKNLWLHSVRAYISWGLFFYYKKIQVVKAEDIPKDKPILFLSNHQNALLDALLIATTCGRYCYFLTRASVFKKPVVSKLLKSLRMFPIYRVRDGWNSITNNNPIFEMCTGLLNKNEVIAIFPEGSHNLNRTVRTLRRGFTRIVFDTLEKFPESDLQIIPIGVNFEDAKAFGDSCTINYGKAISAKDYVSEDRNIAVIKLKEDMHGIICELTTHIESDAYNETLTKLNSIHADFLEPKKVNKCISNDFSECDFKRKKDFTGLKRILKGLLILNLIVPYAIWKLQIVPNIKEEEFIGTFRFATAISLVPIWILAIIITLAITVGLQIALMYLVAVLCLTLFAVKA